MQQRERSVRSGFGIVGKVALATASVLAALMVCELALRAFVPVRAVGPTVTTYDPFYGKALRRSASVVRITPEFRTRITTNSLGFRGPELGALARRPILFLGDSFTLGYGVDDGEEFPALVGRALRARRPDVEIPVINAGLGDNGNGRAVKFLRSEGRRYDPALVVLQIHDNDLEDNMKERLFELTSTGELHELPVPRPSGARRAWELVEGMPLVGGALSSSYLAGLLRQTAWIRQGIPTHAEDAGPVQYLPFDQEMALMTRLLDESLTICDRAGWPVLAVAIDVPDLPLPALERVFGAHRVPTVVVPPKRERPDLYYAVDGHMNAAGHAYTAARILEAVDAHRLLDAAVAPGTPVSHRVP